MKSLSLCHTILVNSVRKFALAAALIWLAATVTSCRTVKEIQIVTDSIVVHDTTLISVHDTTKFVDVRYDSIDRYVEKITYVDTNGVVHEKEIEHLTKIINAQKEEYKNTIDKQRNYISLLEKKIAQQDTVKEVEKPLKWYQKTLMYAGVLFFLSVIVFVSYIYLKKIRKD